MLELSGLRKRKKRRSKTRRVSGRRKREESSSGDEEEEDDESAAFGQERERCPVLAVDIRTLEEFKVGPISTFLSVR